MPNSLPEPETGRNTATEEHSEFATLLAEMAVTSELLTSGDDLTQILHELALRSQAITGADFAAISTFDENGILSRFIYTGISEQDARRLGSPPVGRGLLGHLWEIDRPLRLDDLKAHPRSSGWPAGHPDMVAFIGVPIRAAGRTIGSFYVTRLRDRPPFSQEAELALAVLALQAAVSLSSAFARERLGRLYILEERERIAHDLHDGTIQSLYALGLSLDSTTTQANLPDEVREQIQAGIDQINNLISEIRAYISVLGAKEAPGEPELSRDLAVAVRQLVPAGVTTVLNITAAALQEISAREAEDLLYITREALSNAVRHGSPTKIAIDLRQSEFETALTVQDNGVGYDQAHVRPGLGTASARNRAERLGGELTMLGIPGMGATVRVTIPRSHHV